MQKRRWSVGVAAERLQKILSHAGVSSRRVAEELILAGRVAVNGVVVTELGARADAETDDVLVDGVPVVRDRYHYLAVHKPWGLVTTRSDEFGRETVMDLVPPELASILHPVGRLDRDSEGLIILTNDGHLTERLTHPRNQVEKEYLVKVSRALSDRELQRMVRGLEHEGERMRAHSASNLTPPGSDEAWLRVVLREGKKREIRRMLEVLGREVRILRRVRIGPVNLGRLEVGQWRELSGSEVASLYGKAPTPTQRRVKP